jgi:hypothetical protein
MFKKNLYFIFIFSTLVSMMNANVLSNSTNEQNRQPANNKCEINLSNLLNFAQETWSEKIYPSYHELNKKIATLNPDQTKTLILGLMISTLLGTVGCRKSALVTTIFTTCFILNSAPKTHNDKNR